MTSSSSSERWPERRRCQRLNSNYTDLFRFFLLEIEGLRAVGEVDIGNRMEDDLRWMFLDPDQVVDLTSDDDDDGYTTPPPLVRNETLRCPPPPSKPRSGFERRNM
jgi:hypothetical protein